MYNNNNNNHTTLTKVKLVYTKISRFVCLIMNISLDGDVVYF